MPDSQYIRSEPVGQVLSAQVLQEKITDRECTAILSDLIDAARAVSWRIALDLSKVMLLASAGLGTLINLHKQCVAGGGKLVVFGLSEELVELMKLTKLNKLLTISESRDAALKKAAA
jgi:anti-sigma B factor antagonist